MSNEKVNKTLDAYNVQDQSPLRGAGKSAPDAFIGKHKVLFCGSTGLPTTPAIYSVPGITIGRLQTGVYGVRFPRNIGSDMSVTVQLSTPTGVDYQGSVGGLSGVGNIVVSSGGAELRISQVTNATASGARQPMNPSTGTVADLVFFVSPILRY